MRILLYKNSIKISPWIKLNDMKKSKIQYMQTNPAFEKLQEAVLQLLQGLSTEFVMYSPILAMLNIYDLTPVISASTPINEPVQHVMDIDTKRQNYNFCRTLTCHVNYVNEKDINLKCFESNGDEKLQQMSSICTFLMHQNFSMKWIILHVNYS